LQHVAYRGAAPAVQDLLGGQVPFGLIDTASVQQYIATGKARDRRGKSGPAGNHARGPTLAEQGLKDSKPMPGKDWSFCGHAAGDRAVEQGAAGRARVHAGEGFQALALEAMPGTPQQMTEYTRAERQRWGKVVHAGVN
jgi:tripartite-type tricarboxylate transporter receptor subunit TctC